MIFRIVGSPLVSTTQFLRAALGDAGGEHPVGQFTAGQRSRIADGAQVAIVFRDGLQLRELLASLDDHSTILVNADDAAAVAAASGGAATVLTFGQGADADFRAEIGESSLDGTSFALTTDGVSVTVRLRAVGEHQVLAATAALAAASVAGVPSEAARAAIEGVQTSARWTMELSGQGGPHLIINDAAEATPDSMAASLKSLAQFTVESGRSVAVLGEMDEVGEYSRDEHDRIGRLVVRLNIKKLVVVGHNARHIHNAAGLEGSWDGESVLVDNVDEAYDLLRDEIREGDVVLVKACFDTGLHALGERLAEVVE